MLHRLFPLDSAETTIRTEILAGTTTFFTLCYILFVQPVVMSGAGIDFEVALVATCVASAVACFVMGFVANYPIALAPAMGHNFFFAFVICGAIEGGGMGLSWQQGLAAVFLSGSAFLLLSTIRFRERIIAALPDSLKHAIAAGIGLLVAWIGLQWGGIIVDHPATLATLGDLRSPPVLLTLCGLAITLAGLARQIPAALGLGIVGATLIGGVSGVTSWPDGIFTRSLHFDPTLPKLDFAGLFGSDRAIEALCVLFFLDLFDTVGTLVGVGSRAGLLRDGKLPRAGRALFADATGTIVGASMGTSTVTSYVESAAGVQAGGRSGLTAVTTGVWFLLALFFLPLISVIGAGVPVDGGELRPLLAPTLIAVGGMMMQSVVSIEWGDPTVALPCFLGMIIIPLSGSITDGIAFAVIGLSVASIMAGRFSDRPRLMHGLALLFVVWYATR